MLETKKQRWLAIGAGALGGLALMGGAAFAQTPSGTATPAITPAATATATTPSTQAPSTQTPSSGDESPQDGGAAPGQHADKDCPQDQQQGDSSSSQSVTPGSWSGARGPRA
jgi:hypothetical protein